MTGYLRCATADLMSLLAAIARSPIVVRSPVADSTTETPDGCFADWCAARQSADLDAEILAWILSHVGAGQGVPRVFH